MFAQRKWLTITGWVITLVVSGALAMSATMKFLNPPEVAEASDKFGFPEGVMFYIGVAELTCMVIYLIPRTAVLGAVLLTGYLGGAVVTHVRLLEDFSSPVIMGVLVWLALFLRYERVRELLPIRLSPTATSINHS